MPSARALFSLAASFASCAQFGSSPQRISSATRSPCFVSRTTGTIDIGATFQRFGKGTTRVTLKPSISVFGSKATT